MSRAAAAAGASPELDLEPMIDLEPAMPNGAHDGLARALDPSLAYLFGRIGIIETRVRAAVERRRADDPDPGDRFRGLYISDAQVDGLLDGARIDLAPDAWTDEARVTLAALDRAADAAEAAGHDVRLRRLARAFSLDADDVELLLIALAPDLDPRFERLYGYLHDDVSRRRASTGLALELAGAGLGVTSAVDRVRLGPHGALVSNGIVLVEEPDRPFLTRPLRVADRVAAHLLGDDQPDAAIVDLLVESFPAEIGDVDVLVRAFEEQIPLVYVREKAGSSGRSLAAAALQRLGRPVLQLDLARLGANDNPRDVAAATSREAGLRGAGIVAGPVELLAERGAAAVRAFAECRPPVVLVGNRAWDPAWAKEPALILDAPVPSIEQRHSLWVGSLNGHRPVEFDPAVVTIAFRLAPDQIKHAAQAAHRATIAAGRQMTVADVASGARAQNAAGLERLARRIEPRATWADLVLPEESEAQIRELTARARHRDTVIGKWGMGGGNSRRLGVTALFAGDSGTGKTMSAEVLAGDLGFDLYVIDLSTVVDKYIGETEKNLDKIFTEADRVNGVLLFDEADALFGKRSEVKDARDRYANVEVAYLLQRMESFDGLAILTTNLRANVDEAFIRRLDAIVDFALPEEAHRRQLWERNLPPKVPRDGDIDLEFLAKRFKLSGGDIRNICVAAAFLAAAEGRSVSMGDLIRATEREYQKLGRLTVEAEFGKYLNLTRAKQ
ncbi:MAG TPA: AAA family ATPase [Candidatus Limnocylindrales bacterium]|nr:AAA family ATPase [Candidatus Limnocylindrales bacterium]